jgi:hypothetical protein
MPLPPDPTRTPNPEVCPVCGKANLCAMELEKTTGQAQGPCWCTRVDFSAEVLGNIPAPARGKACICEACATRSGATLPG